MQKNNLKSFTERKIRMSMCYVPVAHTQESSGNLVPLLSFMPSQAHLSCFCLLLIVHTVFLSHSHRITELEGTLKGNLIQLLCNNRDTYSSSRCSEPVQPDLKCLQGQSTPRLSGQPVPVHYHPYHIFFLCILYYEKNLLIDLLNQTIHKPLSHQHQEK